MWWNNSLHNRLLIALSLGVGLCMTILFVGFDHLVDHELYRRFDASLTSRARTAALYYGAITPTTNNSSLSQNQVLPEFRLGQHREFFQVWDQQGHVVARSEASLGKDMLKPEVASNGEPQHFDMALPDGHRGRAVVQQFALPAHDVRHALTVLVAEERDQVDALENKLHTILVIGTVMTLLVLLLLIRLILNRSLQPLARYADQVSRTDIHGGMSVPQPNADLPDELLPVARQFSSALDELSAALNRERRFARDVAHELRTPIAEARALAETALQSSSTAVLQHHLREIGAATRELDQIVSSLLLISRYEAGIEQPAVEPINLVAELQQHLARLAQPSEIRALQWQLQLPAECWLQSDPVLLNRLLANILDNATAHAADHSCIHLQLQTHPPRLTCRNDAPLLDAAMVTQLGQRFVRAPTPSTGQYHAGLGLALCHSLAKVLNLSLELQHVPGSPPQFLVTLSGFEPLEKS